MTDSNTNPPVDPICNHVDDHAWIITRVFDDDPEIQKEVGTMGPFGISGAAREQLITIVPNVRRRRFRMYDDDGELIYEGRALVDTNTAALCSPRSWISACRITVARRSAIGSSGKDLR